MHTSTSPVHVCHWVVRLRVRRFGRGGYADKRPMKVSFKSCVRSRMRSGVQDYARSPSFVLLAYSIFPRATMNDHIYLYFSTSAPYTTEAAAAGR